MKLEQGQIWKQGDDYIRIISRERISVDYRSTKSPYSKDGQRIQVTKKEFCRLIKGAELLDPKEMEPETLESGPFPI